VTVVFGGPRLYAGMVELPRFDEAELGSLRFCLVAGGQVPASLIEAYLRRGIVFLQHYGLTEAATRILMLDRANMDRKAGSVGRQQFFTEVRVVRPDMSDVAVGEIGEVVARGPSVTRGYWQEGVIAAAGVAGGWLRTGDAARVDEDGFVYLIDRLADAIDIAGERVFPSEIEQVVRGHPAVADCAAVDAPGGGGLALFVVARPGARLRESDVLEMAARHLPPARRPSLVRLVDRIPRNASDKIIRRALRDALHGDAERARA
jgi:fatty-acyl-CoA synthase